MYKEEIFLIKNEESDSISEGSKKNLNKKIRKMKLLYKVSLDGDSAKNFPKLCDNISNILTIFKTSKNKRFRGFIIQKWSVENEDKSENNAFIFNFDNKEIYYNSDNTNSISDFNNMDHHLKEDVTFVSFLYLRIKINHLIVLHIYMILKVKNMNKMEKKTSK